MTSWNRVNDGTTKGPALHIEQSWWAMGNLGENGREWSFEEKFHRIAEAGFSGISAVMPPEAEWESWKRQLEQYQFSFSTIAFPRKVQDLTDTIRQTKQFGAVQYINSQVMDAFVIDQEATELLQGLLQEAESASIPLFIETHRGTVTQDLIRTADYVNKLPELKLVIDLSHYVVAGEMNGTSEAAEAHFDQLLRRTAGLHGRISNGEQVQVDAGPEGEHPMVEHFTRWWRKGMSAWLKQAQPGDLLPFIPELGPPYYYAITEAAPGGDREISDRWQQALLLKRIAEEQWKQVLAQQQQAIL
ncbi:sugar phosphate isomerase/epimerase family protein [Paenibacillus sp. GCM10023252]|uniref:sugar phosphate isomerase/epimerase family protein n=1 Tax=Paenibacillus sp. GCM10023252 TaxID=3252649 RepID=UPI003607433A